MDSSEWSGTRTQLERWKVRISARGIPGGSCAREAVDRAEILYLKDRRIEDRITSTNNRFAVTCHIVGKSEAWTEVILVRKQR